MEAKSNTALVKVKKFEAIVKNPQLKDRMSKFIQDNVRIDHLVQVAMVAAHRNPRLFDCSQESVMESLLMAGELNLDPGGTLQHAALVPYKGMCQFQLMFKGLIELARRSGVVTDIQAEVVYAGDFFDYRKGISPKLDHVPWEYRTDSKPRSKGEVLCAYAVAFLADGKTHSEVLTAEYLNRIKSTSKAQGADAPWVKWPEPMMKKSAVKALCKYLPQTPQLAKAIEVDNINDGVAIVDADFTVVVDDKPDLSAGRKSVKKAAPVAEVVTPPKPAAPTRQAAPPPPAPSADTETKRKQLADQTWLNNIQWGVVCTQLGINLALEQMTAEQVGAAHAMAVKLRSEAAAPPPDQDDADYSDDIPFDGTPATDAASVTYPVCDKCGADMEDKRKWAGKVAFKCPNSNWDKAAKKEAGCPGVIWQDMVDKHPDNYPPREG